MSVKMTPVIMAREAGLALVGSLLLVSMLAVMSTTFLLLMAADVRIAQSHFRSTQAYYLAESAAEIASLLISAYPDTAFPADSTIAIVTDTLDIGFFGVYSYPPALSGTGRRQLRIRAASGKAWYDLYAEIVVPTQDPRTYYPVVAGSRLRLKDNVRIVGGDGVWQNGSGLNDPEISDTVTIDSPSAGAGKLFVSGEAIWDAAGVDPALAVAGLEIESNHPTMADIYPALLDDENFPYPYHITGDPTEYRAQVLSGPVPVPLATNPMAIYVWDSVDDGDFTGGLVFNGTIVCPGEGRLRFENGDVTIAPRIHISGTTPDELYPAIVSRGEVEFRGSGVFHITGLVYAAIKFRSDPSDTLTVLGAVIADDLELKKNTTIIYNTDLYTMPAAAFLSTATHRYPVIHFHRRRFLDLP